MQKHFSKYLLLIIFISFQTNSSSALNNVNFVVNKIGMITDNYSTEYLLM